MWSQVWCSISFRCALVEWVATRTERSCMSLFFEVEECRLRSLWEKQRRSFWEECERQNQYGRRKRKGGGWGMWFWLGSDLINSVRVWRWVGLFSEFTDTWVLCWGTACTHLVSGYQVGTGWENALCVCLLEFWRRFVKLVYSCVCVCYRGAQLWNK